MRCYFWNTVYSPTIRTPIPDSVSVRHTRRKQQNSKVLNVVLFRFIAKEVIIVNIWIILFPNPPWARTSCVLWVKTELSTAVISFHVVTTWLNARFQDFGTERNYILVLKIYVFIGLIPRVRNKKYGYVDFRSMFLFSFFCFRRNNNFFYFGAERIVYLI